MENTRCCADIVIQDIKMEADLNLHAVNRTEDQRGLAGRSAKKNIAHILEQKVKMPNLLLTGK
ncbi:hypothetical protein D7X98_04105 [bacterium 1XD8-76]|nr:hypothetical protein D7X98_04105 [bacterium 1XD8-76]